MNFNPKILEQIEKLPISFQNIRPVSFSMNGIQTETILLDYKGSVFVYVPGQKNVTLGWNPDTCELGENILNALKKYHTEDQKYIEEVSQDIQADYDEQLKQAREKGDYQTEETLKQNLKEDLECYEEQKCTFEEFKDIWDRHLRSVLSPIRKADISSMIVEVDSSYIPQDMTYQECLSSIPSPFVLPTEDEWEYLVNGGTQTLFRWGDSLEQEMNEIFSIGQVNNPPEAALLDRPNMFGLYIANNSYQYELVDDTRYIKGGDGGCSLCGGDGLIYVAPCYSAFYRHPLSQNKVFSKHFYSYRRIIRLPD